MTYGLVLSVCANMTLAAALVVVLLRQTRFRKPHDPKVSVYIQKKQVHGWVSRFALRADGSIPLSDFPARAEIAPLSEVRGLANALAGRGFYVKVVRTVHPEHWKEEFAKSSAAA